jgi:hypothetical protein
MNTFKTRWRWWPALALSGGLIGFFGLVVYVDVIRSQGGDSVAEIAPWAILIALGGLLAWVAPVIGSTRVAWQMLIGSTLILGGIGVISHLFPVLVPAAILTGLAAYGASPTLMTEDTHS